MKSPKSKVSREKQILEEGEHDREVDFEQIKRKIIHSPYEHQLQYLEEITVPDLSVPEQLNVHTGMFTVDDISAKLLEEVRLPGTVKYPCEIYGDGK